MAYNSGWLDPTGSGSKGTRVSAIYDTPINTRAEITAPGYFDEAFDEMRRIGWMRVYATDQMFECRVTPDYTARTITLTVLEGTGDADLLDGQDGAYYLAWGNLTGVPLTFAPSAHSHPWADISGEPTTLAGYGITDAAALVHGHAQADITGLVAALAAKEETANKGVANGYASLGADGKVPTAQLAADSIGNTFLANMAAATLKGRASGAGTGDPTDLTAVQARTILNVADGATANSSDAVLLARANHTGTQAPATIAFAATARLLGRNTAGAGAGEELDAATARTLLGLGTAALKDYTETAVTPVLRFGGLSTGITYAGGNSARCIQIGKMVIVSGSLRLTSKGTATGVAQMVLTGAPASDAGGTPGLNIGYYSGMAGLTGALMAGLNIAAVDVVSFTQSGAAGASTINDTNFTNTTWIAFTLIYFTA